MQLQLYMASFMKPYILEQHDFYVAQTNKRKGPGYAACAVAGEAH